MSELTLEEKVRQLVVKSLFRDDIINGLAKAGREIDINAVMERAQVLYLNVEGVAIGRDSERASIVLQSIKTLMTVHALDEEDVRIKRQKAAMNAPRLDPSLLRD